MADRGIFECLQTLADGHRRFRQIPEIAVKCFGNVLTVVSEAAKNSSMPLGALHELQPHTGIIIS